jgi:hypothetical protein
MTPESLVHKIAKFYLPWTVHKGIATTAPLYGQVLTAEPCAPAKGAIPNLALRVRGRTGRELSIDLVDHHATFFETWDQAFKS